MTGYEKLKALVDQIPGMIAARVTSSDSTFRAWEKKTIILLKELYTKDTLRASSFCRIEFAMRVHDSFWNYDPVASCCDGLKEAEDLLKSYLEDLSEGDNMAQKPTQAQDFSKVFIVHGHDGELKSEVARLVKKQGIEAIILAEMPNKGQTIIEKFESNSDVNGAICLFTADDVTKEKGTDEEHPCARPNVIFETGFFWGKLGRDHTIILADKSVDMPSDLKGIVYIDTNDWKIKLLQELRAIGYPVDMNKLLPVEK